MTFTIFAALPAAADPRTIADCEKIQEADAYNQCLASFGPAAHKRGVSVDPEGGGNGGGGASTAAHSARRGHGAHAAHASPRGSHGRGRHYHASRPGRHATGHHQYGRPSSKHMSSKHQTSGHRAAPTHVGRHRMEFKIKR